jgi:hypothetical protein
VHDGEASKTRSDVLSHTKELRYAPASTCMLTRITSSGCTISVADMPASPETLRAASSMEHKGEQRASRRNHGSECAVRDTCWSTPSVWGRLAEGIVRRRSTRVHRQAQENGRRTHPNRATVDIFFGGADMFATVSAFTGCMQHDKFSEKICEPGIFHS